VIEVCALERLWARRPIADERTGRTVKLNIGGSVYDPTDPIGRLLFTTLP